MRIFVDIDDTICTYDIDRQQMNYSQAIPNYKNIERVNKLFDEGNAIYYWSARGTVTGIDWRVETEKQLERWGAKYTGLIMGKPYYDIHIDDRSLNSLWDWSDDSIKRIVEYHK